MRGRGAMLYDVLESTTAGAMHPYPHHLVTTFQTADGTPVTLRPIRAEDAVLEQEFVRGLSDEARYYRFRDILRELTPAMLKHLTEIDYQRHMALIAVTRAGDREIEIGVGRYVAFPDGESCEFAIVISDGWQAQGIATALIQQLMEAARAYGLKQMTGEVTSSNHKMLSFVTKLGFKAQPHPDDPQLVRVSRAL